jgi:hypothetical protein
MMGGLRTAIPFTPRRFACFLLEEHGLINYIEPKEKCRHLKKLTCKGTLWQAGVYLSETPSRPRFFLGWSSNFVGSESDQIQNVKLLQNMVSNRTQHTPPPPPPLYFDTGKGEEEEMNQREG